MLKRLKIVSLITVILAMAACTKEKSYEKSLDTIEDYNWRFVEGGLEYSGLMDTAYIQDAGGVKILTIEGRSSTGTGEIGLAVGGETIEPGTYVTPVAIFYYLDNGNLKYETDLSRSLFSVTITQVDESTVTGTFSGTVFGEDGLDREIVEGTFKAPMN